MQRGHPNPRKGLPQAPRHLSRKAKDRWNEITAAYDLDGHAYDLLRLALEALDRCEEARTTLDREGCYIHDRFGQTKAHPAVSVERDSRLAVARLFRELALDGEPEDTRPPRLY